MEGGCLDEQVDHFTLNCAEALKKVIKQDLITLFENSRKVIGASTSVFKTVKCNTKSVAMLLARC